MAGTASDKAARLRQMRDAAEQPAPDLLASADGPAMDGHPPLLPQPCPVTPLGVLGSQLVFLDRLQQVQIASSECRKGEMTLWFGHNYLEAHFEQDSKRAADRWDQRKAQIALIEDCQRKGIFNPAGKVLGRGAHSPMAEEGTLVLHMGREVLIARPGQKPQRHPAGMVKLGNREVFFPAADPLPRPSDTPAPRAEGEALLALFGKWHFADQCAPQLLLGWVAQAFICGALGWRAHVWLPGPTASGKSSLQKIIRAVLDPEWVLSSADTSEAGVRQRLDSDTLPVSLDEAEKHDNPERLQGVLNLMKKASSGDMVLRGGTDHKAKGFEARSCFLLSSVLHATMRGEDRNRIALLEMLKLPQDVAPLEMELARWRSAGRRMHRRMVEEWTRWEHTLALYRRTIGEMGYEGRWQDTYGTLLACADLLLYDHAPDDIVPADEPGMSRVKSACAQVLPLMAKGRSEARNDTERALIYLLSKPLAGSGGQPPEPIGAWLARAMGTVTEGGEFETDPIEGLPNEKARERLKSVGLRVVERVDKGGGKIGIKDARTGEAGWQNGYLALAYPSNAALQELWRGTEWVGDGYLQSLRKVDGDCHGHKVRFNASGSDNALLVPLAAFRGDEG